MSDVEIIVTRTKELEQLLKKYYRAEGQGMHQLISSCEERLPHDVVAPLRDIATMRNKAIQDEPFVFSEQQDFLKECHQCVLKLTPRSGRFIWWVAVLLMSIMTAGSLLFYYINWEFFEPHLFR